MTALRFTLIVLALFVVCPRHTQLCQAQNQNGSVLSRIMSAKEMFALSRVSFDLGSEAYDSVSIDEHSIRLESLPSGEVLATQHYFPSITWESSDHLTIYFRKRIVPKLFDNQIKISLSLPSMRSAQSGQSIRTTEIRNLNNQLVDAVEQSAKTEVSFEKTSREKEMYLSAGIEGGEAAMNSVLYRGNAWKMRDLIDVIDMGFKMDRGAGNSDPDALNFGLNFRKIFPLRRGLINGRLRPTIDKARTSGGAAVVESQTSIENSARRLAEGFALLAESGEKEKPFWRAVVVTPLGPHLETNLGGHSSGLLLSFVNRSELEVRTGAKLILGRKNQTTINERQVDQPLGNVTLAMKLVPIGFESGVALRNPDDPGRQGSPLFRLNTGVEAKFTYNFPCRVDVLVNRIELETKALNRHLFNEESALDSATQKTNLLVRGNKFITQADLKFIFGFVIPIKYLDRRPAVTVTFKNGFFPPLYSYTNKVSVRFTLESRDDSSFEDLQVRMKQAEALRARP